MRTRRGRLMMRGECSGDDDGHGDNDDHDDERTPPIPSRPPPPPVSWSHSGASRRPL